MSCKSIWGCADLQQALAHYRELAPIYDRETHLINRVRRQTIEALALQAGDIVLDAGCGTGFCFAPIAQSIGPSGSLVAFDPSLEMLQLARQRSAAISSTKIVLLQATAEKVRLPVMPNAIVFSYTHDIIRSQDSLFNLFSQCRTGARVAATSTKLFPRWFIPGNLYLHYSHRRYITNFEAFAKPWDLLQKYLENFSVCTKFPGSRYIAIGNLKPREEWPTLI